MSDSKVPLKKLLFPFYPTFSFQEILLLLFLKKEIKRNCWLYPNKNVKQYKLDKLKQAEKLNPEQRTVRILTTMQKGSAFKELPMHIECFDNSNIQGTNPVAACVVFKKAKPSKKDYRHYHIKTVEDPMTSHP